LKQNKRTSRGGWGSFYDSQHWEKRSDEHKKASGAGQPPRNKGGETPGDRQKGDRYYLRTEKEKWEKRIPGTRTVQG